jgi:hypothetical protein
MSTNKTSPVITPGFLEWAFLEVLSLAYLTQMEITDPMMMEPGTYSKADQIIVCSS